MSRLGENAVQGSPLYKEHFTILKKKIHSLILNCATLIQAWRKSVVGRIHLNPN